MSIGGKDVGFVDLLDRVSLTRKMKLKGTNRLYSVSIDFIVSDVAAVAPGLVHSTIVRLIVTRRYLDSRGRSMEMPSQRNIGRQSKPSSTMHQQHISSSLVTLDSGTRKLRTVTTSASSLAVQVIAFCL